MGNVFKNVVLSEKFDFTGTIDKIVVLAEKVAKRWFALFRGRIKRH